MISRKTMYSPLSLLLIPFLLLACTPQREQPVDPVPPEEPIVEENPNLVQNGSFDDSDGEVWSAFFNQTAEGVAGVREGEFCFDITNAGEALWNVQLVQGNLDFEANRAYAFSFEAYADVPAQVYAAIEEDGDDFSSLAAQTFEISDTKTSYEFIATLSETAPVTRIQLGMGGELLSSTPATICFDNVEVLEASEGGETGGGTGGGETGGSGTGGTSG